MASKSIEGSKSGSSPPSSISLSTKSTFPLLPVNEEEEIAGDHFQPISPLGEFREFVQQSYQTQEEMNKIEEKLRAKYCKFLPFYPNDWIRQVLDIFLIFGMIYSMIFIPLRIAFGDTFGTVILVIDIIVEAIFWIDLVFAFFSCFYRKNGYLETSIPKIAWHYLVTWFAIDLIANIFYILGRTNNYYNIATILRLCRGFRLHYMYTRATYGHFRTFKFYWMKLVFYNAITPKINRIVQLNLGLFFFAHFSACMFYAIGNGQTSDNTYNWIAQLDGVYADNDVDPVFSDSSNANKWLTSLYWTVTTLTSVGYGDIVPRAVVEILWSLLIQLVGISLFVWFFTQLGRAFSLPQMSDEVLIPRIVDVFQYMRKRKVDQELQFYVVARLAEIWRRDYLKSALSWNYLVQDLDKDLQNHVSFQMHRAVMNESPLFTRVIGTERDVRKLWVNLSNKMTPQRIPSKGAMSTEGQIIDHWFIIENGKAAGYKVIEGSLRLREFSRGDTFGECCLLEDESFHIWDISLTALTEVDVLVIPIKLFLHILSEFPKRREEIIKNLNQLHDWTSRAREEKKKARLEEAKQSQDTKLIETLKNQELDAQNQLLKVKVDLYEAKYRQLYEIVGDQRYKLPPILTDPTKV